MSLIFLIATFCVIKAGEKVLVPVFYFIMMIFDDFSPLQ